MAMAMAMMITIIIFRFCVVQACKNCNQSVLDEEQGEKKWKKGRKRGYPNILPQSRTRRGSRRRTRPSPSPRRWGPSRKRAER